MAFNDLFTVYPNRNSELRALAKSMYEYAQTIAREPSAAHSNGLDEHALNRQRTYVAAAKGWVEALRARPIPDHPALHPTDLPIDFSEPLTTFTIGVNGNQVPINEATQLLAEQWMFCAIGLAKSQSAAMAGSLVEFDYTRLVNNLEVIAKLLNEIEERPFVDLPETSAPGSSYQVRSGGSKKV